MIMVTVHAFPRAAPVPSGNKAERRNGRFGNEKNSPMVTEARIRSKKATTALKLGKLPPQPVLAC